MKSVSGFEIEMKSRDRVEMQNFSKNVGETKCASLVMSLSKNDHVFASYYPEFKVLRIGNTPMIWFPVDSYESALTIFKNLSGAPMLTKKALEYANRDIKDDADKLMPTNKTIAWKKRDKGDRPTCPGHPG